MSNIYKNFALAYDLFMRDTPYDKWVSNLHHIFGLYEFAPKLILELACGTGQITARLAKLGYDMIGLDISNHMLMVAREKRLASNILYIQQDMRGFELYGTVDCIICLCDGINYITDHNDLLKVFMLVSNYLNPGGLFIFDLNTEYKFKNILAQNSFCQAYNNNAYIWENSYDENKRLNRYDVDFFIKVKNKNYYRRFKETHFEKAYSMEEIIDTLLNSKLTFLKCLDTETMEAPNYCSERLYFISRK